MTTRPGIADLTDLWIALGIDRKTETLLVLSIGANSKEVLERGRKQLPDNDSVAVFRLPVQSPDSSPRLGQEIRNWFIAHTGESEQEARRIVKEFGKSFLRQLNRSKKRRTGPGRPLRL